MTVLSPAHYIDTDAALQAVIPHFTAEPFLALDTESNSLYAYREQVCLFQVSTRRNDYIIDPFGIADMTPLGAVLANPRIEKIFHAAEYDLIGIKRDFGFTIHNIFDTMLAARAAGHEQPGLDVLVNHYLGVRLDKRHQRDNWGERPLNAASLHYAQMDTHFLPMLRNDLYDVLHRQGRLDEVREAFEEFAYIEAPPDRFDPDGFWHLGRPARLSRRQMAVLREAYLLRETLAEARDCPPYRILSNAALIEIARLIPRSKTALAEIKGLPASFVRRYGDAMLEAIETGQNAPLPRPPRPPRPSSHAVQARYTALQAWRRRQASQRGVDSDLILSKNLLRTLAESAPQSLADMQGIPGLGPWRLAHYGPELLEVLRSAR
jgi:ribonuclease D